MAFLSLLAAPPLRCILDGSQATRALAFVSPPPLLPTRIRLLEPSSPSPPLPFRSSPQGFSVLFSFDKSFSLLIERFLAEASR